MTAVQKFREVVPTGTALPLAAGGLAATAATHAAVLTGKLPHTAVSGGRVSDTAAGRRVAAASLCALAPMALLTARGTGIAGTASRSERVALGVLATASLGSVPLQAMGTSFERRFMTPTAAALAVGLARLAVGA